MPEKIDKEVKEHSISKDAGFIYLGNRIEMMDAKIDRIRESLDKKIETIRESLKAEIEELKKEIMY